MQKKITLLFIVSFWLFNAEILKAQEYTATLEKIAQELSQGIQNSKLKAVAIVDFTDNQDVITELGKFLAQKTLTQMTKYSNSFSILNRDRLNYLLEENKLSVKKGLVDQKTAVKLGKVTGVDALVIGKITPLGSNGEKIDLSIQVVKLETLEVIAATEGTISNTPAMKDLLNIKISSSSTERQDTPSHSIPVGLLTPEKSIGDFKFRIKSAKYSGDAINVVFQVLNNTDQNRQVIIYNGIGDISAPVRININGNIIPSNRLKISGQNIDNYGYETFLTAEVWVSGEYTFPIKGNEITEISSIEISIFDYKEYKYTTAVFKNVKL